MQEEGFKRQEAEQLCVMTLKASTEMTYLLLTTGIGRMCMQEEEDFRRQEAEQLCVVNFKA